VKLLSTRACAKLWKLQDSVREAAGDRNRLLRVLLHAHGALAGEAQREMWLEFSCADQEYRYAVTNLARFCESHGAAIADTAGKDWVQHESRDESPGSRG